MPSRRIVTAALLTAALRRRLRRDDHARRQHSVADEHARRTAHPQAKAKRHAHKQTVAEAERAATATTAKNAPGTAAAALAKLPVKGRAPKTGYSREQFGDGWIDTGGCDTRDRILTRDLTAKSYLDDCRVESGTLADPYTGERVQLHPRRRERGRHRPRRRALRRLAEGRPAVDPGNARRVRQ